MNWISVEDRLPEQKGDDSGRISKPLIIWVVDPSGHYGERYMERFYLDGEFEHINEDHIVTHWILQKDFKDSVRPLNTPNE